MKIELSEQDLVILDSALEVLNKAGLSRRDSQEILKLSVKLQAKPKKDDDSK